MHPFIAEDTSDPMVESLDDLFHAIIGIFEGLAEVGKSWGEPWGWLFPTLFALATALAFFAGWTYVFRESRKKVRPLFFFVLLIVGLLAFAAIQNASEEDARHSGHPVVSGG